MVAPSVPNFPCPIVGGVDFRRIDTEAKYPLGFKQSDQWGQVYVYAKCSTDLTIADADEDTLIVSFTRTLNAGTGGAISGTTNGDGSVNGALNNLVVAATGASALIDGVIERRVPGTGVQIDGSPTSKYIWVKVAGIANRLKKAATLDVGQFADRIADGGAALVEETAAGASLGTRFGYCIAEHTTTGGAGLAGDFVFDVEF